MEDSTCGKHTPDTSIFLRLPSEIRLRIYRFLFAIQPNNISFRTFKRAIQSEGPGYSSVDRTTLTFRLFGPRSTRPFILIACKTTYTEAWEPFMQAVILHYGVPDAENTTSALYGRQPQQQQQQIDNDPGQICESTQAIWARHATHGSNISVSVTRDLPRIQSIYDNIQISYRPGFPKELARLLPNLRTVTVRRDWAVSRGYSSMFTGHIENIVVKLSEKDVQIGFIPRDADGEYTDPKTWYTRGTKYKDVERDVSFDIVVVGVKDQRMRQVAQAQIDKYMEEDRVSRETMVITGPAPLKTRDVYLLGCSRRSRGTTVLMHFGMIVRVSHVVDLGAVKRRIWASDRAPFPPENPGVYAQWASQFSIFGPEMPSSEPVHESGIDVCTNWNGWSCWISLRKLDVVYDWDTGELVDLKITRTTRFD